ncbi:MAG: NAD(P)H-hydrate epimerase [Candidatus Omnitrophica bacterium]|nr:NAD(P)H-hydrate epimerase [Candidatus Omnitrophota bacterium]
MRGFTAEQLRGLDESAKSLGLGERLLIENASSNLFSVIHNLDLGKRVLVVSGKGNNGADVLSCARKLFCRGYKVQVAVICDKALGKEADFQLRILKVLGIPTFSIKDNNLDAFKKLFKGKDFILEGILGTGVKGQVSGLIKKIIKTINQKKKTVISCDIPSGLCPDKGIILGQAVNADYTVTFIAAKKGFFINHGPKICGKIIVVDIGVSLEVLGRRRKK